MKDKPKWILVNDSRNSISSCFPISHLDFSDWWFDNSFNQNYIHVKHSTQDCYDRVFCVKSKKARIGMKNNRLYWIY